MASDKSRIRSYDRELDQFAPISCKHSATVRFAQNGVFAVFRPVDVP